MPKKTLKNSKNKSILEKFVEANKGVSIKATLKILGRIYESQGNTVDEVLNNFKTQDWIKGAGVIIMEKWDGEKWLKKEKIISGNHIRNVFGMAPGTMRQVSLKWLKSIFE